MEFGSKMVLFGVLFASLLLFGCVASSGTASNSGNSGDGRVVFAAKDAAANMGTITSVRTTIDSVQVHSEARGWVTVSSTPKTIDLMALRASGDAELLADAKLANGTYTQMNIHISRVVVTDAQGEHEAKLPSNTVKIVGNLVVKSNSTSTALFDFVADESLHLTGQGTYILAPVIKAETRTDANVQVTSNNKVLVSSGNIVMNAKVGMDINGNVGAGRSIPADVNLSVSSNGQVSILPAGTIRASGTGRAVIGIADPAGSMGTITSVNITVDSVRLHSATQGWVDVSTTSKTFDLLELNASGKVMAFADANVTADTYDQLRLGISKVTVTDADGTHNAKLPSGELKIMGEMQVRANATATAVFDFAANESIHRTGNGKYIMTPVIQLETRSNATVIRESDGRENVNLRIIGGSVRTSIKVGMDVDGNVGVNLIVPANANVTIETNGNVVVVSGTGGATTGSTIRIS